MTKWIIHNADTEDVFTGFCKASGMPNWESREYKAKYLYDWSEVEATIAIIRKCGFECYPETLQGRADNNRR